MGVSLGARPRYPATSSSTAKAPEKGGEVSRDDGGLEAGFALTSERCSYSHGRDLAASLCEACGRAGKAEGSRIKLELHLGLDVLDTIEKRCMDPIAKVCSGSLSITGRLFSLTHESPQ